MIAPHTAHQTRPLLPGYRPSGNSTWNVDTGNRPYIKFLDPEPIAALGHGLKRAAGTLQKEPLEYGNLRETPAPTTTSDLLLVAGLTSTSSGWINTNNFDPSAGAPIPIGGTHVGRMVVTGSSETHATQFTAAHILPYWESKRYLLPSNYAALTPLDFATVRQAIAMVWNYDAVATDIDLSPIVEQLEPEQDDPFEGYEKYNQPNWDGFGAEPVTASTLDCARQIFDSLPDELTDPHIAPGADGSIGLYWSWDEGPFRSLCIDVGPGDRWRAYWQQRDKQFGNLPSRSCDQSTATVIAKLMVS